jgi:hypothetical protein
LVESANELLYRVTLPDRGISSVLVTGSDKELDAVKPPGDFVLYGAGNLACG